MPSMYVTADRVSVDAAELKELNGVKLVPGMPVEVYIEIGESTFSRSGAPRLPGRLSRMADSETAGAATARTAKAR